MSKLSLFVCVDCGDIKFSHRPGVFSVDDVFYCFRCENYTENYIEEIIASDSQPSISLDPGTDPGESPAGHPLSER